MDEVSFLPTFPLFAANMMLVGAVLLCGLAAGHVFARYLRLPRITGFVAAGLVLGSRHAQPARPIDARGAVDLRRFLAGTDPVRTRAAARPALAHARWQAARQRSRGKPAVVLFVYWTLRFFDVAPMYAATAAAIAVATSPAVLLMIVHDQRAKGPLTERMLTLTGLNNVIAFLVITLLFGFVHLEYKANWVRALLHPLYLIAGSAALGYLAFVVARWLARGSASARTSSSSCCWG